MDSEFYQWAKKTFLEMKDISNPYITARSMIKGVLEREASAEATVEKIVAILRAFEETK